MVTLSREYLTPGTNLSSGLLFVVVIKHPGKNQLREKKEFFLSYGSRKIECMRVERHGNS